MLPLARGLKRAGYRPINLGYFAIRQPIEEITARLAAQLLKHLEPLPPEHALFSSFYEVRGVRYTTAVRASFPDLAIQQFLGTLQMTY